MWHIRVTWGALRNPKAWAPPQNISLESPRVGPGVGWGFFLKLPRCFQGAAEGGNCCFTVPFGELHVIKLCCLYACLIIKVILACCLKKKKSRDPDSAKIITFSSLECSFQIKKYIFALKKKILCVSQDKMIPHLSKEKHFF